MAPNGKWLASTKITWWDGTSEKVGREASTEEAKLLECGTWEFEEKECINTVSARSGGYVEKWSFVTSFGRTGTVGDWNEGASELTLVPPANT